jgi:hypothetical protein
MAIKVPMGVSLEFLTTVLLEIDEALRSCKIFFSAF